MIIYRKTIAEFLVDAPLIADIIFRSMYPAAPAAIRKSSEYEAWQNSVGGAMSHVLYAAKMPSDAGVAIEYRINGSSKRIDFVITGLDERQRPVVHIVELKQWQSVDFSELDDHVRTFVGGRVDDHEHPSAQADGYAYLLNDFYEVVRNLPVRLEASAYLHNLDNASVVRDDRYRPLLDAAPVFIHGEHQELANRLAAGVSSGDRGEVIDLIDSSPLSPSQRLVDAFKKELSTNDAFRLIDDQRTAYFRVLSAIKTVPNGQRRVIVISGGPGTGKSVIAIKLMGELLRRGKLVNYATKNGAPRAILRGRLHKGAERHRFDKLFINTDSFMGMRDAELDVALIDEAHRLVEKSGLYGNLGEHQIREAIKAARVAVFFVDDRQSITWRDIGSLDEIRRVATEMGVPVHIDELRSQFRCAGSESYMAWVERTLGYERGDVGEMLTSTTYDIDVAASAPELRDWVQSWNLQGRSARLVAGYCWDWVSKRDPSAQDIVLDGGKFSMKWNLTADGSRWLDAPRSADFVGCVHTIQGLEADYVGVIMGDDFVVRDGTWRADAGKRATTDRSLRGWKSAMRVDPVGTSERLEQLIRNSYWTLLTRGMRGSRVFSVDAETREYLAEALREGRKWSASASAS